MMGVAELHNALERIHKKVAGNCCEVRTKRRRLLNARTGIMHVNVNTGGYVLIRNNKAWKHKLRSEWIRHMRTVATKLDVLFVVEDILRAEKHTVQAQLLIPRLAQQSHDELSEELKEQAEYLHESQQGVR